MVAATVQAFLRRGGVAYSVFSHAAAFSAQQEAAVTHLAGPHWAKTVVCFADGEPIQAVVPADCDVHLKRLLNVVGSRTIRLATASELDWLFPDCERGAVPPFGPLYKQRVYVDDALTHEPHLIFNGGTHSDAICMRYPDFASLARPLVGSFADRVSPVSANPREGRRAPRRPRR
jgi:Ala-tRNA(Pro) deacylase